jgi:hypothetical protein
VLKALIFVGSLAIVVGFSLSMYPEYRRHEIAGPLLFLGGVICFVGGTVGHAIVEAIKAGGRSVSS